MIDEEIVAVVVISSYRDDIFVCLDCMSNDCPLFIDILLLVCLFCQVGRIYQGSYSSKS